MTGSRIVVIGAGPTGLGAGYRLQELGHEEWDIIEANDYVGGLATSFTDRAGFTYDIGGHVMFSHYEYYDQLVEKLLDGKFTELEREAWVWMEGRFIPYPFQTNIGGLDPRTIYECVSGLVRAQAQPPNEAPQNFREWVLATFGAGIAEHFMLPYNFKVWATPPELMNQRWIAERVAVVDADQILRNVILREDNRSWGPNNTFKYPERGGTGYLYEGLRRFVEPHLHLRSCVQQIDARRRVVTLTDGRTFPYDQLLSTMPLNHLVDCLTDAPAEVREAARQLVWSGSHIVGVGVDRPADTTKNWIYFPEQDVPFYRVTYLSNYSPYMTPKPDQTLFLTETSRSPHKPEDAATIVDRVIDGLVATGLMQPDDRHRVVSTWLCSPEMSYPVPSVERDAALEVIQPWLREHGIWSRGRFGAWLYEIGNMDHSTMQGVEFANAVLLDEAETVWYPTNAAPAST